MRKAAFLKHLFKATALPILSITGVLLLYVFLMSGIDHKALPFPLIIGILALVKTFLIASSTFLQLSKMIKICHSAERLITVFGLLIGISVLSFATDYTCLYQFDTSNFSGNLPPANSYAGNLFSFFYFSVITFSSVGFGDIEPASFVARFVVILEILLSFIIVVFALANIKKIHIYD